MPGALDQLGARWLVVVATAKERDALGPLDPVRFDPVVSGVGKSPVAAATARILDPARHAGVLSLGLAGAYPESGLRVGDIVIADRVVLADEGSENPDGFRDLGAMGFGPIEWACAPGVIAALRQVLPSARVGTIATVSTCSGTDARARAVASRTGAIAEAMEGAAVALAAGMVGGAGFPFAEVRAISNTTGDRPRQVWNVPAGFAALGRIAQVL